jgi:YbdK family carboxylate-amine ligase
MSGAFTVGVEEEYQIVDPDSGALVGQAPEILARDASGTTREEFQRTMLEIATPVCSDIAQARAQVAARRRHVAGLAGQLGLTIAAAGLHPEGATPRSQISEVPRYWRLAARGGVIARELHIFGMHVHVAVDDLEQAVRAMAGATPYIPVLLALSASSPFHEGRDTAFSSFRTLLRDMFPRVGLPLPVETAEEYDRLETILSGAPRSRRGGSPLSWDIRPSHSYPTLEFRFTDVCASLDVAMLIAACARALTATFVDRPSGGATPTQYQILKENRWRAARAGMEARFHRIDREDGREQSAADAARALVDRLGPVAERLGDAPALLRLERILEEGDAAAAMRTEYRRGGSLSAVTRAVVERTLDVA